VGALAVAVRGFDAFAFDPSNEGIDVAQSGFPFTFDGQPVLLANGYGSDPAHYTVLSAPGVDTPIGTFTGPYNSAADVALIGGYDVGGVGYTFLDAAFSEPFLPDSYELRVIPEPNPGLLLAAALAIVALRRRPALR
jgi:hypothetical protein